MQLPNTRISDRLFLVLAVGAALFALFMHWGIANTNLPRHAWASAAKYIRTHYQPGDAIAFLPPWALKGAEPLRDLPVLYAEHLHQEDLSRYKRLWVLLAPRLGKWWFRRAYVPTMRALEQRYWRRNKVVFGWQTQRMTGKSRVSWSRIFGQRDDGRAWNGLEVYLYHLPPARPMLFDFMAKANLRRAEVGLELPPSPRRVGNCPASAQGEVTWLRQWQEQPGWFRAGGDYFFGRIVQEIGNTPRDCLWAQTQACRVLKVRYRNVPLHGELRIEHGFTTASPAKVTPTVAPSGPDIVMSVWAENRRIKEMRISQKQIWRTSWLHLKEFQFPRKFGSVEFQIRTPDHLEGRVGYCFRAEIRQP